MRFVLTLVVAASVVATGGRYLSAQEPTPTALDIESVVGQSKGTAPTREGAGEKKFRDFAEVTKGAEKLEGLFNLYKKDEHLYAEIKPTQLDQPLLAPIAIARGIASAGSPLNFGDEWVLVFRKAGDKLQLVRRNIHYKAPANSPLQKAVEQNYTDSILMALPIVSINPSGQGILIDFSDIFLTDFAQLGLGSIDRNRTRWSKVKAFPKNLEMQVEATYGSRYGGMSHGGLFDDGVADARGVTVVIHYSLVKMPEAGYKPRLADDRVGHFLSALKDFGSDELDTNFVRQINRWRLEKANPKAKLSPPKKRIVWWVEETVPHEYRPYVEDGIREWNKAFEKIGFRDAIEVRWQDVDRREGDGFDPEDINYCTFRWITTSSTFAMSCLRANPVTGEMIDGDVIFDASWIRYWKRDFALLTGSGAPTSTRSFGPDGPEGGDPGPAPTVPIALGEVISPIMALKKGYGLPVPLASTRMGAGNPADRIAFDLAPAEWGGVQRALRQRMARGQFTGCQFNLGMRPDMALAAIALADRETSEPGGKVPEEFIGQAIKEVVMHEVGHSLGLRHNFKASTMLDHDELNDPAVTRARGNTGSVMDYNPINIAPRGEKQGDYYSTTIGPYDYWAIEYAYSQIEGNEAAELKKIAARSPDPDLVYATDEDMYLTSDPLVNAYDLGSDPLEFARERIALATDLLDGLEEKMVPEGDSWARLRAAFSTLLGQWGNAAYLASAHVGGHSVSRDHRPVSEKGKAKKDEAKKDEAEKDEDEAKKDGDEGEGPDEDAKAEAAKPVEGEARDDAPAPREHAPRDPITPIAGAKQREALTLVVEEVLSDKSFKFPPALLRKLASERWYHWGDNSMSYLGGGGVDYPVLDRILAIQSIVLGQCLDGETLTRLQDQALQADPETEPLRMSEVFRALTDGIWSECPKEAEGGEIACSDIRRNLQRAHLKKLGSMVLGSRQNSYDDLYGYVMFYGSQAVPADARSLARMHLKEIGDRLSASLERPGARIDDTTRAHLDECRTRIETILNASLDLNEP